MAQKQHRGTPIIGFKSIQLLKDQTLGIGSYGSVCKALCDDLICAAKIIHPTLFDPNDYQQVERNREHRLPMSRFMQECEFMSAIRHPNIIQFLGTHQDPQTGLPVLLMELMDDSLTHFLKSSQDTITYHIQVNLCHDITLAISYLHSNGITHRDLSSNNVLLRGRVKAKVTDFGMAKLVQINPQATHVSFTLCRGTDVYMPPEAVKENTIYTEKMDCFSIGTLIIQILTRCFPDPGDRQKAIQIDHPQLPGGTVYVPVTEIERRENHISLVDPNHPLLPIALDCLKDSDVERPSAQELCHRIGALKEIPQFIESTKRAQKRLEQAAYSTVIDGDIEEIRELEQGSNDIQQNNEVATTRDNIQKKHKEKESILVEVTQKYEKEKAQMETQIHELKQQLASQKSKTIQNHTKTNKSVTEASEIRDTFTLKWREGKKAPQMINRGPDAVVDGDTVYFRVHCTGSIYTYDSREEKWDQLRTPDYQADLYVYLQSIAIVDYLLTTVGGRKMGNVKTNKLSSLTGEGRRMKWRAVFPPMPTKRSSAIVVSTEEALIVAGGEDEKGMGLTTVEIMEIETQKWSTAQDLPEPLFSASATIINNRIYIIGGFGKDHQPVASVYTCTLTGLFLSCQSRLLEESITQSPSQTNQSRGVWNKVADLPVYYSTCVTLHGQLLAIGGCDSENNPTSKVHIYRPTTNTWEVISQLNIERYRCFAAVLPTNELMVVGGYTSSEWSSETDSVEIATVD